MSKLAPPPPPASGAGDGIPKSKSAGPVYQYAQVLAGQGSMSTIHGLGVSNGEGLPPGQAGHFGLPPSMPMSKVQPWGTFGPPMAVHEPGSSGAWDQDWRKSTTNK